MGQRITSFAEGATPIARAAVAGAVVVGASLVFSGGCGPSQPTPDTRTGSTTTSDTTTVTDTEGGLVGTGLANPFPSRLLLDGDGHLAIQPGQLPSGGDTPHPTERLTWRTGFSAGQTSVLDLPGLRSSGLPSAGSAPGEGSVRMVDLTDGRWLYCMAELDAHPEATEPVLIVRPLEALIDGHEVGVVVTTEVADRPDPFAAMMAGDPPADLEAYQPAHDELIAGLDALGMPADEVGLAWSFPVDRGEEPLVSALAQHQVSGSYTLLVDDEPSTPDTFKNGVGTFEVTEFLIDDVALELDGSGGVTPQGTTDAYLYVHVPASVADAPAGSVPVMVFGHGIFASPDLYLAERDDPSGVLSLADELGVIVVGTNWRGLTTSDLVGATAVASDFGRFHELTDRLVQAQVNVRTLAEAVRQGAIIDHADLVGASGQVLADPDQVVYYGISLGGIAGSVMWANDPPIDAVAFHVGGAMWSTMLERSSNFPLFEAALVRTVPEPADRQFLYSFSQLFWDPVDPITWVPELAERDLLLSIAVHDEQVPNMTSEALARSIELPLLQPAVSVPSGLTEAQAPLQRAFVQLDPGMPPPPDENRPAPVTDAHTTPRLWEGHEEQVVHYLNAGVVEHFCGDTPCTSDNPGAR